MSEIFTGGLVYLVKGKPECLWWLLKDQKNVRFFFKPSIKELANELEYDDLFEEELVINIAVIRSDHKEYLQFENLSLSQNTCNFLLLSDADGTTTKEAEKVYKTLCDGRRFKQMDVDQWDWAAVQPMSDRLSKLNSQIKNQLLTDFLSPSRLDWQLRQSEVTDYEVGDSTQQDIKELLNSLGKPESFRLWESLPKASLHRLFATPDLSQCGGYKILAGGGTRTGLCPNLWVYLSWFIENAGSEYSYLSQPCHLINLFVRWIYLSSTVWKTPVHKGWYVTSRGRSTYWNFDPSPEAFKAANDLFSNPSVWNTF